MVTVSINVIAAEENAVMVPVNKLLVPTDYFSSWRLTEVLAVKSRVVAVSVDVLCSLLSDLDGVTKRLFELSSFGSVTRRVDRETLNFDGRLRIRGCSCAGYGDSGDFSVSEDGRGSSGCSKCCTDKELSTHVERIEKTRK